MTSRLALPALLLATALLGFQLALLVERLPETVASHFDASGNPDGFTSRETFLSLAAGLGLGNVLLFVGLAALTRRLPDSLVNLPHREHWLAPERRDATRDDLARRLLWLGAITQLLLVASFHLILRANEGGEPAALPQRPFWISLGAYGGYVAAWVAALLLRYGRDPARARSRS